MKVAIYPCKEEHSLKYVVIATRYKNQYYMVKHKERETWEIPGGHIEAGESPDEAAVRELYEETGGRLESLTVIGDYSVTREETNYGRLYLADIAHFDPLPDSEIEQVALMNDQMDWTYESIQPKLLKFVEDYLKTT